MKIKAILFDLDGTLLPMNQDEFTKAYFGALAKKMMPLGYDPNKLIEAIWSGTKAMIKNDGKQTNEIVFWNKFSEIFGEKSKMDIPYFDEFYKTDFDIAKTTCGFNKKAKEIIKYLKQNDIKIALATNPIFPKVATEKRIAWAGLSPDDFKLFTTYENSNFCKPNLEYYKSILTRLNAKPEDCLMVGNDVSEDMVAKNLGMKVFLLTDCLINKENIDFSHFPNGNFDDLLNFIKNN